MCPTRLQTKDFAVRGWMFITYCDQMKPVDYNITRLGAEAPNPASKVSRISLSSPERIVIELYRVSCR